MVMVSLVTPGAVAPPLSPPFHGATQGGAYPLGTATFPVEVSQFGPQSTLVPAAFAWSKVSGPEPPAAAPAAAPAGPASATTVAATSRPTNAREVRRGRATGGHRRARGAAEPVSRRGTSGSPRGRRARCRERRPQRRDRGRGPPDGRPPSPGCRGRAR